MGKNYPYCEICSGCGEEGCCSPLICEQHPKGDYCKSYLRDLKFGYAMTKIFQEEIYEKMSEELKREYDKRWDEEYDRRYKTEKDESL